MKQYMHFCLGQFDKMGGVESSPGGAEDKVVTGEDRLMKNPSSPDRTKLHMSRDKASDEDSVAATIVERGEEILVQGFNWESHHYNWYQTLLEKVPELKAAGFTGIWLPPASDSLAPQGYLPKDLYCLNSAYGSSDQLRHLLRTLKTAGIRPIADVVINHRIGSAQGNGGQWNRYEGMRMAWDETAVTSDSYGGLGNPGTGETFEGAPNIDHSQEHVQQDITEWLRWLKDDVGFSGFRFDYAKGYSPDFVKKYIEAVRPDFAVGEYWDACSYGPEPESVLEANQEEHRQRIVDWIDGTGGLASAFDFTTKGVLQEAVSKSEYGRLKDDQGRPPGVIGLWPARAVSFVENHDTGSTQNHWPFPKDEVLQGYAYILTHPGVPTVFYDHYFEWGGEVKAALSRLIQIRRQQHITSQSKVHILEAKSVYVAEVDDCTLVKLGQEDWAPPDNQKWCWVHSGRNYSIWTREKKPP